MQWRVILFNTLDSKHNLLEGWLYNHFTGKIPLARVVWFF